VDEPTQHAPGPESGPDAEAPDAEADASPADAPAPGAPGLGDRDLRVLAFERQWWRHAGAKEQAIREDFGLSSARYYQILGALIDSPAALAHDPMLVKRLQRVRDSRAATRAERARRMGDDLRRRSDRLD
jgi:hypothetical protein